MPRTKNKDSGPPQGKADRYIQPSILLGLLLKISYGYELIQNIQMFGFIEGQAPPGMIYRHLRQLEQDGLVHSNWVTEGAGPAKRVYQITDEGKEVLALWIGNMRKQAENLNAFIKYYEKLLKDNE
ncbi:Transcriptional regulator, PadR family [uncultured Desulfobacterium sp.]|uniref:Transcriptional regulator, PadR family n=1 Tax=uncultured Desulfobacterium sp. TaxID=201089 RepID=A0A445N120_9BACT|nr:Transcriptional regulator, PadR family [uncultured Desulfobacterium sp.]